MPDGAYEMGAPTVSERTWTEWQVRVDGEDAVAFSSEDRDLAEKWLGRLRGSYVLARVERRSRCESWWGEPETVPWHSPCSWVAAATEPGERPSPAWCTRHGGHGEDEPVPAEFWTPRQTEEAGRG